MRSVPDHLSVLPISPCHSQRFAQSNTFHCHWNLPTCNEGCKPYLHLGIVLSQQIPAYLLFETMLWQRGHFKGKPYISSLQIKLCAIQDISIFYAQIWHCTRRALSYLKLHKCRDKALMGKVFLSQGLEAHNKMFLGGTLPPALVG